MMVLVSRRRDACLLQEAGGVPMMHQLGAMGANLEGKEVRFGIAASALFATVTTAASCGAVNAMHDSFTALGGLVPMFNMQLGEVIVGGVGAGMYGFLLFALLAIFVAGLMVGRTPEYVGKKIEGREVKFAVLAIAVLPLMILGGTALASVLPAGLMGPENKGPHGFSEILYAFSSATANNGSAFAGITSGTPFYNGLLAVAMWIGRFFMFVPALAIAGSLAAKKYHPESGRFLPDDRGFVGRPAGGDHPDRRRPHVPARARTWPHRRSSRDDPRPDLLWITSMTTASSIFSAKLVLPAIGDAFRKLDPRALIKNPVLFTTAVVALLLTVLLIFGGEKLSLGFQLQLIVWLWLTVLFGTFAEALAEGRGRAQAASLRATKSDLVARLPNGKTDRPRSSSAVTSSSSRRTT